MAVRNAAASSISAIALIEIPIGMWNDIFDTLGNMVQSAEASVETKVACVETIRYICEDLSESTLPPVMSSTVMMLLLYCLQASQPTELWDEAIQALDCALAFAEDFMKSEEQCRCVMEAVFNATSSASLDVQGHAFQCLGEIFDLFYASVPPFFQPFYGACEAAIRGSERDIAIQAAFALNMLAVVESESKAENRCLGLCQQCYTQLVQVLCEAMTRQDEDDDGETMTPAMAAATCLGSFAEVVGYGGGESEA